MTASPMTRATKANIPPILERSLRVDGPKNTFSTAARLSMSMTFGVMRRFNFTKDSRVSFETAETKVG